MAERKPESGELPDHITAVLDKFEGTKRRDLIQFIRYFYSQLNVMTVDEDLMSRVIVPNIELIIDNNGLSREDFISLLEWTGFEVNYEDGSWEFSSIYTQNFVNMPIFRNILLITKYLKENAKS